MLSPLGRSILRIAIINLVWLKRVARRGLSFLARRGGPDRDMFLVLPKKKILRLSLLSVCPFLVSKGPWMLFGSLVHVRGDRLGCSLIGIEVRGHGRRSDSIGISFIGYGKLLRRLLNTRSKWVHEFSSSGHVGAHIGVSHVWSGFWLNTSFSLQISTGVCTVYVLPEDAMMACTSTSHGEWPAQPTPPCPSFSI